MKFTELKFDPDQIDALVETRRANLKANKGLSDALPFWLRVASSRLASDPRRYLDYGPYWWSLKAALNANGYNYGDAYDSIVAAEYIGRTEAHSVIMADQFRMEWLEQHMVYTDKFRLEQEGDDYALFDADMEARAAA